MTPSDLNHREVLDLLADLTQATEQGTAVWKPVEGVKAFYLRTPGGVVRVEALGADDHPFVVQIRDENERPMYEMRTEVAPFYSAEEDVVARLYAAAKNSVYDVSGTVRRIRRSLGI